MVLRFGTADTMRGRKTAIEFMAALLDRGTKKHDRQQIQDMMDKYGAELGIGGQGGALVVNLKAKRKSLGETLDLLTEILREPTFPDKELELLKAKVRDELEKGKTDPQALGILALERKLAPYPPDDVRYVPTIDEDLARTKAATVEQAKAVYTDLISAQAGELAVVGD